MRARVISECQARHAVAVALAGHAAADSGAVFRLQRCARFEEGLLLPVVVRVLRIRLLLRTHRQGEGGAGAPQEVLLYDGLHDRQ